MPTPNQLAKKEAAQMAAAKVRGGVISFRRHYGGGPHESSCKLECRTIEITLKGSAYDRFQKSTQDQYDEIGCIDMSTLELAYFLPFIEAFESTF